jgi:hypothetical protein
MKGNVGEHASLLSVNQDRWGKVAIQLVHFGDTIHLAGIFRCKNGWTTTMGPVGEDGAVMDIKPPGEKPHYEIPPICEYPSERHFGSCPGIASFHYRTVFLSSSEIAV